MHVGAPATLVCPYQTVQQATTWACHMQAKNMSKRVSTEVCDTRRFDDNHHCHYHDNVEQRARQDILLFLSARKAEKSHLIHLSGIFTQLHSKRKTVALSPIIGEKFTTKFRILMPLAPALKDFSCLNYPAHTSGAHAHCKLYFW